MRIKYECSRLKPYLTQVVPTFAKPQNYAFVGLFVEVVVVVGINKSIKVPKTLGRKIPFGPIRKFNCSSTKIFGRCYNAHDFLKIMPLHVTI